MGPLCSMDAAAFSSRWHFLAAKDTSIHDSSLCCVPRLSNKSRLVQQSVRKGGRRVREQQLERSHKVAVPGENDVRRWDDKTALNGTRDLVLAIRHRADVASVLDSWVEKLSLQEWNKIVNNVGGKHWTYAMQVFNVLKERSQFLQPSNERFELNLLESYTCLVGVLAKQARVGEAEALVAELRSAGVKPDTIFFNALLGAYANMGLVTKVCQIMEEMESTGMKPDNITFEKLIVAYLTAEGCQLHKAVKVLRSMEKNNLQVSARTFLYLIDACCKQGDTDSGEHALRAMRNAGHVPQMKTWNKMMQLYGSKGDYSRAEELLSMLTADGLSPNSNFYDNFLIAYRASGARDQAFSVFREYKGVTKATLMAYNIMIDLCGKTGWASEALALFAEASDANLKPNTVTYTTMISALAKGGMYKEVDEMYEKMLRNNVVPNIQTYTSLIHACTERGWTKRGKEICTHMQRSGCDATVPYYGAMLALYVRGAWYSDAAEALMEMESKNVEPDVAGYAALIAAFGEVGNEVVPLLRAMEGSEFEFCRVLYGVLAPPPPPPGTEEEMDSVKFHGALDLLEKWTKSRTQADNLSIHNAIMDALWTHGLRKRAKRVMSRIRNAFDWYVLPSFGEMKWTLNLRCLSVGAAQVVLLEWFDEAVRQAVEAGTSATRVIITAGSFVGGDAPGDLKSITPPGKSSGAMKLAIASSLKERGASCVLNPSGELVANTKDVMDWISAMRHRESLLG